MTLPCELDSLQGIDEAGKYDEASDPGLALTDESKDGFLHPLLGAHLPVRWPDNVPSESHCQVAEHDIDGCNASKPLYNRLVQRIGVER